MSRLLKGLIICIALAATTSNAAKRSKIKKKQDKIDIVINLVNDDDPKLAKILNTGKEVLQNKTDLKLANQRRYYLESQGKIYLLKILHSLGYYQASVKVIDNPDEASNDKITFSITPNEKYIINSIDVVMLQGSRTELHQLKLPTKDWYKLSVTDRAIAKSILVEESRLQEFIENNNNILSVTVSHEATIDHINHTVAINFCVLAGELAKIRSITFKGLEYADERYVRRLIPIKNGEDFKSSSVNSAKSILQSTGLFNSVEAVTPDVADSDGNIDLRFKVKERKHKTVKAGLNYSKDFGPGIVLGWENRNLFAQGEKISSSLSLTKLEHVLNTQFEKPLFLSDKQTLKIANIIEKKQTLAYLDKGASIKTIVERDFSKRIYGGTGVKYSFNKISELGNKPKIFSYISIPIYATFDARNDVLDATSGEMIKLELTPLFNTRKGSNNKQLLKKTLSVSTYMQAKTNLEPVLAIKGSVGTITGAENLNIPATERFYGGGGGSIRGYGYQLVGPLNAKKEPLGGRSFTELATELRLRVRKDIGVVAFLDGGNVFDKLNQGFSQKKLFWGAGVGVRYYTNFGPLRADIAFPLIKRAKIDKAFQIYLSIGQAF